MTRILACAALMIVCFAAIASAQVKSEHTSGFDRTAWPVPMPLDVACDANRGDNNNEFPFAVSVRVSKATPLKSVLLLWGRQAGHAELDMNKCLIETALNHLAEDKQSTKRADDDGNVKFRLFVEDCDTFIYQAISNPKARECHASSSAGGERDLAHRNNLGMWIQAPLEKLRSEMAKSRFASIVRNIQNWLFLGFYSSGTCDGDTPAAVLNKPMTVPFKFDFTNHRIDECMGMFLRFTNKAPHLWAGDEVNTCNEARRGGEMQPAFGGSYDYYSDEANPASQKTGDHLGRRQVQLNFGCSGPNIGFATSQDGEQTSYTEADYGAEDYMRDRASASSREDFERGESSHDNAGNAGNVGESGNHGFKNRMGNFRYSVHFGKDWVTMTQSSLNPEEFIIPEGGREFKVPNPFHDGDVIYLYSFGWGRYDGAQALANLPDDAEDTMTLKELLFQTEDSLPEGLNLTYTDDYDRDNDSDNFGVMLSDVFLYKPTDLKKDEQPSDKPDNAIWFDSPSTNDAATINGQYIPPKTTEGSMSKKIGSFKMTEPGWDLKHNADPELMRDAAGKLFPVTPKDMETFKPRFENSRAKVVKNNKEE